MYNFTFQNTTKIYFGENTLENLGAELKKYGKRVLLTYGGGSVKKIGLYDKVITELNKSSPFKSIIPFSSNFSTQFLYPKFPLE